MLQGGRSYTADELARELKVSRRTVFRDLNVLEQAHIPYYYDHARGTYKIEQQFFLPPINLTLSEAMALMVSARRLGGRGQLPLSSAGAQAAMKIQMVLPESVKRYLGELLERLVIFPPPTARHAGLDDMFEQLAGAIVARRACRLVYVSFQEQKQIKVTVEPLQLVFVGRGWYLLAWSREHRERRTFKLGRIKRLTVTDSPCTPPEDAVSERPFGDAWCMIGEGRVYNVHLRFTRQVAGNVAEVNWHHSQQVEWNDDGSVEYRARVDGLGEITWWILGYGDQVKVLQPAELAQRVQDVASSLLRQYHPGGHVPAARRGEIQAQP